MTYIASSKWWHCHSLLCTDSKLHWQLPVLNTCPNTTLQMRLTSLQLVLQWYIVKNWNVVQY